MADQAAQQTARRTEQLHELARLHDVQTEYWDNKGKRVVCKPEALLAVLRAMGAPVGRLEEAPEALRHRRLALWRRRLEPVMVAWDGHPPEVALRLPVAELGRRLSCRLELETGKTHAWEVKPADLPCSEEVDVEGVRFSLRRMGLIGPYPLGYHKLTVEGSGPPLEMALIAAPVRASAGREGPSGRTWGAFIPLYALHTRDSWGAGDLADLGRLVDWVQEKGGGLVATLPLLAGFLGEFFEPSPYSPVSRLFWNEMYIAVGQVPEGRQSAAARALLGSRDLEAEIAACRADRLVDYRRVMAAKRRVLEACAKELFTGATSVGRRQAFEAYRMGHAHLADYAAFRATGERRQEPWPQWPGMTRDGALSARDYDPEVARYHEYVQWVAAEQVRELAGKARARGPGLYLDLPLGVNSSGYDVWRFRSAFVREASAGAPPDPFFSGGQNWGFPPRHPERVRADGHAYLRAYLRHHLRSAGVLRIDHMMGLHRLFWIPNGLPTADGVYVGYRAEEEYAVFNLEAWRNGAVLVGEDLGTVPPEVPEMMARHDIHRMYVMQFQGRPDPEQALNPVTPGSIASFNTHDLPPFAAFWRGRDIDDRRGLGLFDDRQAAEEKKQREKLCRAVEAYLVKLGLLKKPFELKDVLRACLAYLARGEGQAGPCAVLATLEDFWLEERPQNMPGTGQEQRPENWRLKARLSLEEMREEPSVRAALEQVNELVRKSGRG